MLWKTVMRIGIGGIILGILVILVSFVLFSIINAGANLEDALLGVVPGGILVVISVFLALFGWLFGNINRKKPEEPESLETSEDLEKPED